MRSNVWLETLVSINRTRTSMRTSVYVNGCGRTSGSLSRCQISGHDWAKRHETSKGPNTAHTSVINCSFQYHVLLLSGDRLVVAAVKEPQKPELPEQTTRSSEKDLDTLQFLNMIWFNLRLQFAWICFRQRLMTKHI